METVVTETDEKGKSDDETVEKEKEEEKKYEETEKEATVKGKRVAEAIDSEDTEPLSKVLKLTETSMSDEESMSIDDLLQQIPEEMMLPSVTAEEPTKIKFGRGIAFKEVNWYKASLPTIDPTDKGKDPLVEEIKGNPAKDMFAFLQMFNILYRFEKQLWNKYLHSFIRSVFVACQL
ncbi:adenylosuccinate lyase-like [Dorcoceras hygrometricum]|uniref:Adenylosuccinate lyase-like n=1 Tax=Dorcoceras hygrometricum TaxID=472368 RepID=A0A2Z7C732_9LAMI|nr:adenylosuccinate lyase-like [Dorcoceras hygrometricum]